MTGGAVLTGTVGSPRWLCVLRTAAGYAYAMLSLALFLPVSVLALVADRRQRVHDLCAILWARGILALAGVRLRVEGGARVSRGECYVVVANHQSLLDAMIMVGAMMPLTPLRMVAKRSLFRVPLLGWSMRAFGHMAVDHRSLRGSAGGLKQAQRMVRHRWSTGFFPEGTRSSGEAMLPFHNAAFHIAARAGVKVLPVTISGSRALLPKGKLAMQRGGEVRVVIHEPIAPTTQGREDVRALSDQARAAIQGALETP